MKYSNLIYFASAILTASSMAPQPLLWRPSEVPIMSNQHEYYLEIIFSNPCDLITGDVVHPDSVPITKSKCNDVYKTLHVHELTLMCPNKQFQKLHPVQTQTFQILNRPKRELFTIIFCVVVLVTAALASAGTVTAAIALSNTNNLQSQFEEQEERVENIAKDLELSKKAIKVLQNNVNILQNGTQILEAEVSQIKIFLPSTTYIISYISAQLNDGKYIIREAARKWKEHKLHAPLFDYLNFTLPCGETCPMQYAVAKDCYIPHDQSRMFMHFSTPIIDSRLQLLEADPFNFMVRNGNQTCTISYNGPQNLIYSTEENCVYSVNVKTEDIILSPSNHCKDSTSFPNASKYFELKECKQRQPNDEDAFIQVKPYHQVNYIYCWGSNVTYSGKTQQCPNHVFMLPYGKEFSINGRFYHHSEYHILHRQVLDPSFTLNANWHLEPKIHWEGILQDIELIERPVHHSTHTVHQYGILIVVLLILCLIVLVFIAGLCYRKSKTHGNNETIQMGNMNYANYDEEK